MSTVLELAEELQTAADELSACRAQLDQLQLVRSEQPSLVGSAYSSEFTTEEEIREQLAATRAALKSAQAELQVGTRPAQTLS